MITSGPLPTLSGLGPILLLLYLLGVRRRDAALGRSMPLLRRMEYPRRGGEVDAARLELSISPSSSEIALLGANADLWTAAAGFNQDLAIFVSVNGAADQLVAWKESGGYAGTFSPNAAFAQAAYSLASGSSYVFKLKWKTNRAAGAATIYAGAGPLGGQYSPTRISALLITTSNSVSAATSPQYTAQSTSAGAISSTNGPRARSRAPRTRRDDVTATGCGGQKYF